MTRSLRNYILVSGKMLKPLNSESIIEANFQIYSGYKLYYKFIIQSVG